MRYLSSQNIIQIHFEIVEATGGSQGIRDVGLLKSAASRPRDSFGGKDLYPTIFLKASVLVHSLLLNHPFVDGNKRTAVAAMIEFLELNKKSFKSSQKGFVDFALWIENEKPTIEEIADWIKNHTG